MEKKKNKLSQYCSEFWKYRDLLKLLVSRDLKLKYRRSFLGYVWSILNPLLIMIVMAVVFSHMFKRNIVNFPVYLFCGQLLFNYMNNTTHQAIFSVSGNGSLLRKTYMPKYIFTVAKVTSGLIDLCFSLGALVFVMLATKAPFTFYSLLFPFVILQLYVFCIGLGLFLAQMNVFFKDIQYIYNAVTIAWLYVSCIFYPLDMLPQSLQWIITHLNPMYFYIAQFRAIIYEGVFPDLWFVFAGLGAALLSLLIGLFSFLRAKDKFILYI